MLLMPEACTAELGVHAPCARRRVPRGERLFAARERFVSLYTVRYGSFKTSLPGERGHEQITGFFMPGDMLGLDGLAAECHAVDAVALEDSEVDVTPRAALESVGHGNSELHNQLNTRLAREIVRHQRTMILLGTMIAPQRLAAFLLDLSKRFAAQGYSPNEFHLRMTRGEIASYLGLKLETVSRLFSEFARDGLIWVQSKHVRIVDLARLERVLKDS